MNRKEAIKKAKASRWKMTSEGYLMTNPLIFFENEGEDEMIYCALMQKMDDMEFGRHIVRLHNASLKHG